MKRVLVNAILSFFVLPAILFIADYIRIEIAGDHSSYSGSLFEYYKYVKWRTTFIGIPIFYALLVLLPYNIVAIKYFNERTSILKKNIIMVGIQIFWITILFTSAGVWFAGFGITLRIVVFVLFLSYLFTLTLHYLVDKK